MSTPQLRAAMRRGYEARMRKWTRESNPYADVRNDSGTVTFARAYRNAWFNGYDQCRHDELHGDYDGWFEERSREGGRG